MTPLRIIDASDTRSLNRLLARGRGRDAVFDRRVHRIVDRVRDEGDRALVQLARRFDGVSGAIEVSGDEIRDGAGRVTPEVRRAIRVAARHIARVARRQLPKTSRTLVAPGVSVEQRVTPLTRVGCYVPGGRFPLPSSLLMTAMPARVAGVGEIIAVCPRPEPAVMAAALETGVTRLFRIGGAHAIAALAFGTATIPRVDKIVGPGNRYVAVAKAYVATDCAIDFYAGPTEIVILAGGGRPDWIAADLIAQAEHDPDARAVFITWTRALAGRVASAVARQVAGRPIAAASLLANGAAIVTGSAAEAVALSNRIAPEHLVVDRESLARLPLTAGAVFVGPFTAQAAGDYATGSNHVLPTAGASRSRGGLSAADFVRVMSVQRLTRAGLARLAPVIVPLARAEGLEAHAVNRGPLVMIGYQRPPELYDGLRLHQNENTGGCSPRVLDALRALRADQIGFYPPYNDTLHACAAYLGVPAESVALVNGLDEGITAIAIACLRSSAGGFVPEAIVPEPAFEIFRFDTEVVGGRAVSVMPQPDFAFPLEGVLAAITPRTRVVFLTNPNNPTGVSMPLEAIRTIARAVPREAIVFVDEAYSEFSGTTFIPDLPFYPNVIVGRTFSKAFGLAGLRIGCLVGAAGRLDPIRVVVPAYSVNIAAVVAVRAALDDRAFVDDYLRQVATSKALLYAACDRLDLRYWTSGANFVLVCAGDRTTRLLQGAVARGVYLRDRSTEPGCAGCVRIATGIVEHTRRCIAVMDEVLCGAE